MTTVSAAVPEQIRPWSPGARGGAWGAVGLILLAVLETAQALVAPGRAATAADWQAATQQLRADFQPGDLIVAAPAWADPVMRMHVGDLLPVAYAARMDDARFGRVWVLGQHDAHAPEELGRGAVFNHHFGALTLRRFDRPPAQITYDFLERWQDARVIDWDPGRRVASPCPWAGDSFVCPRTGNTVRRTLVEVEQQIRRAILAPPVAGEIIALEFPAVPLGRELVIAAGLHDTWARKSPGTAHLEVWVAGQPVQSADIGNRSGWHRLRIDTAARAGQTVPVRFQISAPQPTLRYLAFAAEARR
ncbi:MAG: hypothetical protein ABI560_13895 [Myxococcales bacterium]